MDLAQWFTNFGVAGVMMFITYVIATQSLPKAFETIMAEMRVKREEFLNALQEERSSRRQEREIFLAALQAERQASTAALSRLETKFEACFQMMSTRMMELTEAVNSITERDQKSRTQCEVKR